MIKDGDIAAARLAQMFGSELLRVQESARTDSGSQPNILNLDPKRFLGSAVNNHVNVQRKTEEQRLIQALQLEAEAAYPIEEGSSISPPNNSVPVANNPNPAPTIFNNASFDSEIFEKINSNIDRLATAIEGISDAIKASIQN